MTIEFRCQACEKLLRTGDDKAGAIAKCPQCGAVVTVPSTAVVAVGPIEVPPGAFRDSPSSYSRTTDFTDDVVCPMCGAPNASTAGRCLACGEELWVTTESKQGGHQSRNFGAVWRTAWETWTANLGICVAAAAIGGGIFLAAYIIFIVMMVVFSFGIANAARNQWVEIAAVVAIFGSAYLLMLLAYAYLLSGFSNLTLSLARRRSIGIGALFPPVSQVIRGMVCTFLVMLGLVVTMLPGGVMYGIGIAMMEGDSAIGFVLVLVGYIVLLAGWGLGWTFFWPIHYLIADEPVSIVAAMSRGTRLALSYPKLSFLMALCHTGLMLTGFLTCYMGFLFTAPLSFVLFAIAYDRCERSARVA